MGVEILGSTGRPATIIDEQREAARAAGASMFVELHQHSSESVQRYSHTILKSEDLFNMVADVRKAFRDSADVKIELVSVDIMDGEIATRFCKQALKAMGGAGVQIDATLKDNLRL